ncbi:MAG: hypothetical protein ACP5O4_00485 [bacterium]
MVKKNEIYFNIKEYIYNAKFVFYVFIFFLFVFSLMVLTVSAKDSIRVYSLFFNPEFSNVINKHIENYRNLKSLSLFDIEYYNISSFKDFNSVIVNSNPDIIIAPLEMYYIIKNKYNLLYFDEYLNSNPTIFSVFKSYTVDFMKNSVYDNNNIYALPLFAYSLYYVSNTKDLVLPKVSNLNLPEVISYCRALSNATDYVKFWKIYLNSSNKLRSNETKSELYSLIYNVDKSAKYFPIKSNTMLIDNPVITYGIFITTKTNNNDKVRSCYYLASKLWDFEVQIDLALDLGVLPADKQTTLHPGYISKLKDEFSAAKYNNYLLKYPYVLNNSDFELYYESFERIIQNDPNRFIQLLNNLITPSDNKISESYLKLAGINKMNKYLLIIKVNDIIKFLYSNLDYFNKEKFVFYSNQGASDKQSNRQSNKQNLISMNIYDVFKDFDDAKKENKIKNDLLNRLIYYKINKLENDKENFVVYLEPKSKDKTKKLIIKRVLKIKNDIYNNELRVLFIGSH